MFLLSNMIKTDTSFTFFKLKIFMYNAKDESFQHLVVVVRREN
jgi:hypothetical protein